MRSTLWVLLVMVTAACGPRELHITMNSDNNSGQTGFAVLSDLGAKMRVLVETRAPDFDSAQNAHIHVGNCGEVGEKRGFLKQLLPLADKPGRVGSTTDLDSMTFKTLATGEWILNVHDARDNDVYVSCGEIPKP